MTTAVSPYAAANTAASTASTESGWNAMGQEDFIRLMTVQMQQQDPFDPVDNTQMLAQMAQFSSLAGIDGVNETLQSISDKLDNITFSQGTDSTSDADQSETDTSASS